MGIKHFFIWFKKNYPECYQNINYNSHFNDISVNIDNLCLDMNGIFHASAQEVYQYGNCAPTYKKLLGKGHKKGMKWQIKFFQNICEKINFYRKVVNPKKRLILCVDGVAGMAKMNQQRQRRFKSTINEDVLNCDFNPVSITPGTQMMDYLTKYIDWYIKMMMTHDPTWKDIEVIFSNEKVGGEGEHKIINFIRKYGTEYESYCIHGLDADLIMLGLATHLPNMYILRENIRNDNELHLLNIGLFHEKLSENLKWERTETSPRFSKKSSIDDFVFMCFLVGNDFVPTIPTLAILEGGIDIMIEVYNKSCSVYGHLTRCKKIKGVENMVLRMKSLKIFLGELSNYEKGLLEEKQSKKEQFFEDKLLNKYTTKNEDKNTVDFDNYRKEFYNKKFKKGMTIEQICHEYLTGLQWVITYYRSGIPSWNWYYKHFYAPFLTDMVQYCDTFPNVIFPESKPVDSYLQLMCVLPPQSANLLPDKISKLITSDKSPISKYYPKKFDIDLSGKRREWEGIVLLPMANIKDVTNEYIKIKKELNPKELRLTIHGCNFTYTTNENSSYYFKCYYGDIAECNVNRKKIEF